MYVIIYSKDGIMRERITKTEKVGKAFAQFVNGSISKLKRFRIISPDGFDIRRDKFYLSIKEAKQDLKEWIKGFRRQGYYSSMNGHIALADLANNCQIIEF
jgi:hypothetical protein